MSMRWEASKRDERWDGMDDGLLLVRCVVRGGTERETAERILSGHKHTCCALDLNMLVLFLQSFFLLM